MARPLVTLYLWNMQLGNGPVGIPPPTFCMEALLFPHTGRTPDRMRKALCTWAAAPYESEEQRLSTYFPAHYLQRLARPLGPSGQFLPDHQWATPKRSVLLFLQAERSNHEVPRRWWDPSSSSRACLSR